MNISSKVEEFTTEEAETIVQISSTN